MFLRRSVLFVLSVSVLWHCVLFVLSFLFLWRYVLFVLSCVFVSAFMKLCSVCSLCVSVFMTSTWKWCKKSWPQLAKQTTTHRGFEGRQPIPFFSWNHSYDKSSKFFLHLHFTTTLHHRFRFKNSKLSFRTTRAENGGERNEKLEQINRNIRLTIKLMLYFLCGCFAVY
jgi:hypothetical protein